MGPHFQIVCTLKWPYCPSYRRKTAVLQAPGTPRTISKLLQDTSSRYRPSASPAPFPSFCRIPAPSTGPRPSALSNTGHGAIYSLLAVLAALDPRPQQRLLQAPTLITSLSRPNLLQNPGDFFYRPPALMALDDAPALLRSPTISSAGLQGAACRPLTKGPDHRASVVK